MQGRLTGLPIYEDEGRDLLHLGLSGGWRSGTANSPAATYAGNTIELPARPEMRDDDPAGSPGGQAIPNANSNRMIDTGAIAADNEYLMGLESLYIRGPFSFQAEYGWNWIDNAIGVVDSTAGGRPNSPRPQNYVFNGGYRPTGLHVDRREPRLRQADRHPGPGILRPSGPYENA